MEESSKLPENDVIALILPEFLVETVLEADLSPEFPIKEEMIEEVMQELYKEITFPPSTCTETANSGSPLPPLSPLSSLSSPFFVNSGKSESCGASVSNSASSVMAGVEFAGGVLGNAGGESVELKDSEEEGEERMMDRCDGVKFGDEWLEKVMGWAPLELEGWS
ncbi:hypothetical protein P3X46_007410 [Hevea brasiliensis]|uniref:Uncharacterized protein n=1 Tax=Hevea brasiliensis TaxID=3981 RepID=A0ABQ9MUF7_HEVBR|nr:hypothetical protein P3X46_007410 [Hevea brasiliensis]